MKTYFKKYHIICQEHAFTQHLSHHLLGTCMHFCRHLSTNVDKKSFVDSRVSTLVVPFETHCIYIVKLYLYLLL